MASGAVLFRPVAQEDTGAFGLLCQVPGPDPLRLAVEVLSWGVGQGLGALLTPSLHSPVYSDGHELLVQFVSDLSVTADGFAASYAVKSRSELPVDRAASKPTGRVFPGAKPDHPGRKPAAPKPAPPSKPRGPPKPAPAPKPTPKAVAPTGPSTGKQAWREEAGQGWGRRTSCAPLPRLVRPRWQGCSRLQPPCPLSPGETLCPDRCRRTGTLLSNFCASDFGKRH